MTLNTLFRRADFLAPDNSPAGIKLAVDTMSPVVTTFAKAFPLFAVRVTTNAERTRTFLELEPTAGADSAVALSKAKELRAKAREAAKELDHGKE